MAGNYEHSVCDLIDGVVGSATRLKLNIESVIEKYNKDFPDDDLIDLYSMEIVGKGERDPSVIKRMKPKIFGASKLKSTKRKETLLKSRMNLDGDDFNPDVSMAVARECESALKPSFELLQEPSDAETLSSHDEDEEEEEEDDSPTQPEEDEEEEKHDIVNNDRDEDEVDGTDEFYLDVEDEKYDADEEDFKSDVETMRNNLRPAIVKESEQKFHQESQTWARKDHTNILASSFIKACKAKKSYVEVESQIDDASLEDSFVSISSPRRGNQSFSNLSSLSLSKMRKCTNETIILSKNDHSQNNSSVFYECGSNQLADCKDSFSPKSQSPHKKAPLLLNNLIKRQNKLDKKKTQLEQDSACAIDVSYSSLYSNKNNVRGDFVKPFGKSAAEEDNGSSQSNSSEKGKLVKHLNQTFVAKGKIIQCSESVQSNDSDVFLSPKGVSVKRTSGGLVKKSTIYPLNFSVMETSNSQLSPDGSLSSLTIPGESQPCLSSISANVDSKSEKMSLCFRSDGNELPFEMPYIPVTLTDKNLEEDADNKALKTHSLVKNERKERAAHAQDKMHSSGQGLSQQQTMYQTSGYQTDVSSIAINRELKENINEMQHNLTYLIPEDQEYGSMNKSPIEFPSNGPDHCPNYFPVDSKDNKAYSKHIHVSEKPLKFNKEKLRMARKKYKAPSCNDTSSNIQLASCEESVLAHHPPNKQPDQIINDGGRDVHRVNEWIDNLLKSQTSNFSYPSSTCPPNLPPKLKNCPSQNALQNPVSVHIAPHLPRACESNVISENNGGVSTTQNSTLTPQFTSTGTCFDSEIVPSKSTILHHSLTDCPPFQPISVSKKSLQGKSRVLSQSEEEVCYKNTDVECSDSNHHPQIHHYQCVDPLRSCKERMKEVESQDNVMVPSDLSCCLGRFWNDRKSDNMQKQSVSYESPHENSLPTVVCRHTAHNRVAEYHCNDQSCHNDKYPLTGPVLNCCCHEHCHMDVQERRVSMARHKKCDCYQYFENPCKRFKIDSTRTETGGSCEHMMGSPKNERKYSCQVFDCNGNQTCSSKNKFSFYYSGKCRSEVSNCRTGTDYSLLHEEKDHRHLTMRTSGSYSSPCKSKNVHALAYVDKMLRCNKSGQKNEPLKLVPPSPADGDNSCFQLMNDEEFAQRVSSQIIKNIKKYLNVDTVDKNDLLGNNTDKVISKSAAVESCSHPLTLTGKDRDCCMFPEEYIHMFSPSNPHRIDSDESSQREQQTPSIDFKQYLRSFRPRRHQKTDHNPNFAVKTKCVCEAESMNAVESSIGNNDIHTSANCPENSAIPNNDSFHFKMPLKVPQKKQSLPSSRFYSHGLPMASNQIDHALERNKGPDFKVSSSLPLRASTPIPCQRVPSNVCLDNSMSTIVPPSNYDSSENTDKYEIILDEASDDDQDNDISLIEM